jgi:hypothetical protein
MGKTDSNLLIYVEIIAIFTYQSKIDEILGSFFRGRISAKAQRRSITSYVDNGLGKGLRRFLRQIVPHAARDSPVFILPREFFGI